MPARQLDAALEVGLLLYTTPAHACSSRRQTTRIMIGIKSGCHTVVDRLLREDHLADA